ncbi:MAG: HDOD domain-containing protein [Myxococcales bacterium]|nr:HDOD domain-containing protein [Myxococcales bacterium]
MTALVKDQLLKKVDTLPVLPRVLSQLLELDPAAPSWFDDLVKIVEAEPSYAIRLIGAANSMAAHSVTPITRIRDAVVRLGAREVSNLIISMSVVRVFVPRNDWERGLWTHALEVASVARALARHANMGLNFEQAYLGGLLHDVGRFIMFDVAPAALREVDEAAWDTPSQLVAAERGICGLDHAELGAEACARWMIPAHFANLVRFHHDKNVEVTLGGNDGRIGSLVQVADLAGFSAVSSSHTLPALVDLPAAEGEALLRKVLPAWYRDRIPGALAAVTQALAQADLVAEQVGVKPVSRKKPAAVAPGAVSARR